MNTTKLYTLLMLLAITLSIAGFTYAHWQDTVQIEGKVKMAHILVNIKSQKVLMSQCVKRYYQSSVWYEVFPDLHTLKVYSKNLGPCWYIWVGLVMQNQGTLPGRIKAPVYSFDPLGGWEDYFETKEYFYGPYPEETGYGTLEVWGNVVIDKQLKSDGTVTFTTPSVPTPFTLDPTEKAVIWIWIHCKESVPKDMEGHIVTLYINIIDDLGT